MVLGIGMRLLVPTRTSTTGSGIFYAQIVRQAAQLAMASSTLCRESGTNSTQASSVSRNFCYRTPGIVEQRNER